MSCACCSLSHSCVSVAALLAAVLKGRNSPGVKEDTPYIVLKDFFNSSDEIKLGNLKIGLQNQICKLLLENYFIGVSRLFSSVRHLSLQLQGSLVLQHWSKCCAYCSPWPVLVSILFSPVVVTSQPFASSCLYAHPSLGQCSKELFLLAPHNFTNTFIENIFRLFAYINMPQASC